MINNGIFQSLLSLIKTTFIGVVTLAIFTIVISLVISIMLRMFLLGNPNDFFHTWIKFSLIFGILYVAGVGIISFFSGFHLNKANTFAWQSFASGFVMGIIGPSLLLFSSPTLGIRGVIFLLICGVISGLIGLAGYGVASRLQRNSTTTL